MTKMYLFFKWEAYTPKIIFLTKNVELFPGIYYVRYTLTLTVTEIHPMTYGQGQGYRFLGHQS